MFGEKITVYIQWKYAVENIKLIDSLIPFFNHPPVIGYCCNYYILVWWCYCHEINFKSRKIWFERLNTKRFSKDITMLKRSWIWNLRGTDRRISTICSVKKCTDMFEKHPDSFSNLTYNLIYQPTPVIERYIAAIIIY